jgi:hypothetical protein
MVWADIVMIVSTFYYTRSKTHSCFREMMASFMDEIDVSKNIQPSLPICYNDRVGILSFSSFVLVPTAHQRFMGKSVLSSKNVHS